MPPPRYPKTGNPGVWGNAGKRKPKKTRRSYTSDMAQADTIARSTPVDGKAFGVNKGFGVYKDKNGKLTYKGTGPVKSAPQGPAGGGSGGGTGGAAGEGSPAMADISGYYKGLAGILQGIGPGIDAAYKDTAGNIAGFGQGFSQEFRDRVGGYANDATAALNAATGNNLPPAVQALVGDSYNAQAGADVGYGLGAYLPAKTLAEQGAAFSAAARFLPAQAAQQGLYALNAQARAEAEAAAKASGSGGTKASASLSKALGYLVGADGSPILDKKGRKIPIPEQGLTPYQQAQLEIAQMREDRYISNENFDRSVKRGDIAFRNAKERRQIQQDVRKGKTIDSAASRVAGHIVYKDGTAPRNAKGGFIPVAQSATASSSPQAKFQKAVAAAASPTLKGKPMKADRPGYWIAKPGFGTKDELSGQYITDNQKNAKTDGYSWGEAIKYLTNRYGITKAVAARALVAARWQKPGSAKPPKVPRPNMSMASVPVLAKYAKSIGINPAAIATMTRDELVKTIELAERNGV